MNWIYICKYQVTIFLVISISPKILRLFIILNCFQYSTVFHLGYFYTFAKKDKQADVQMGMMASGCIHVNSIGQNKKKEYHYLLFANNKNDENEISKLFTSL